MKHLGQNPVITGQLRLPHVLLLRTNLLAWPKELKKAVSYKYKLTPLKEKKEKRKKRE